MRILDRTELVNERVAELIKEGYTDKMAIEMAYDEIINGEKK